MATLRRPLNVGSLPALVTKVKSPTVPECGGHRSGHQLAILAQPVDDLTQRPNAVMSAAPTTLTSDTTERYPVSVLLTPISGRTTRRR